MMLERIIAVLERELATVEHNIISGACPDFTTYREQVAMLTAFTVAIELVKKAFAEDDDE
jgi:hypothetical protein